MVKASQWLSFSAPMKLTNGMVSHLFTLVVGQMTGTQAHSMHSTHTNIYTQHTHRHTCPFIYALVHISLSFLQLTHIPNYSITNYTVDF